MVQKMALRNVEDSCHDGCGWLVDSCLQDGVEDGYGWLRMVKDGYGWSVVDG